MKYATLFFNRTPCLFKTLNQIEMAANFRSLMSELLKKETKLKRRQKLTSDKWKKVTGDNTTSEHKVAALHWSVNVCTCLALSKNREEKQRRARVAEVQQLASPQHLAASDTYSAVPRATSTSPPFFSFFLRSFPLPIFTLFRPRSARGSTPSTVFSNSSISFPFDRSIQNNRFIVYYTFDSKPLKITALPTIQCRRYTC